MPRGSAGAGARRSRPPRARARRRPAPRGRLRRAAPGELLAPVAVGGVARAQLHPDGRGDRAQRLVARDVAELVVVGLEAVDVADRDRDRLPAAAGVELDVGQVLDQRAAVAQPGQRVAAGVLAQALVEPRELRLAAGELLARLALEAQQAAEPARRAAWCARSASPPLISAPAAIVSWRRSGGSSKPVWMSATISATNVIAGRMPPPRLSSSVSTGGSGRPAGEHAARADREQPDDPQRVDERLARDVAGRRGAARSRA